jgi:hypothetical protein
MSGEDVDVCDHRQLDDDDEEQQSGGLSRIRRHHGTFGVFLFVISAVTASSPEKSTNG